MKNVYKWRIVTNKYLYITDEENNGPFIFNKVTKERTYSNGEPQVDDYGVDEGKIAQIISQVRDASTYETMFNGMVTLAMTDEDASKLHFLDYTNYFNLDSEECVQEAVTPKCEGYEPVFNISAHTIDDTEVTYTFFPERNEQDKTLRYNIDLGIPRGEKGEPGEDGTGCKGDKGDDGKSAVIASADATAYALPSDVTIPEARVVVVPESATTETENQYAFHFSFGLPQGPKGDKGDNGPMGYAGKDAIITDVKATVDPLDYGQKPGATVEVKPVSTTTENQTELVFHFALPSGPQGEAGPQGDPAIIRDAYVDSVVTIDYGAEASATCKTIYISGNTYDLKFDFWIPRGQDGGGGGGEGYIYNIDDPVFIEDAGISVPYGQFNTVYHPGDGYADVTLTIHYPASWGQGGGGTTDIKHRYDSQADSLSEGVNPSLKYGDTPLPLAIASGKRSHAEGIGNNRKNSTFPAEIGGDLPDLYFKITTDSGGEFPSFITPEMFQGSSVDISGHTYTFNFSDVSKDSNTTHFYYDYFTLKNSNNIIVFERTETSGVTIDNLGIHTGFTISLTFTEPNAIGMATHTEGSKCRAIGDYSHAEGLQTEARGVASHAEGIHTFSNGDGSHAEGCANSGNIKADAGGAHAGGYATGGGEIISEDDGAFVGGHASGKDRNGSPAKLESDGNGAFVYGCVYNTTADTDPSCIYANQGAMANGCVLSGANIIACGDGSHAEGYADGSYSEIYAYSSGSYASGYATSGGKLLTESDGSHAEGYAKKGTITASGIGSHAEGFVDGGYIEAGGDGAHAEGCNTIALGDYSHAEGYGYESVLSTGICTLNTTCFDNNDNLTSRSNIMLDTVSLKIVNIIGATFTYSGVTYIIEKADYKYDPEHSHSIFTDVVIKIFGDTGQTTYDLNHVINTDSVVYSVTLNNIKISSNGNAIGRASHTEGGKTLAYSDYSHAEGWETEALGVASHAEGGKTTAGGDYSHSSGFGTIADNDYMFAVGKYNTYHDTNTLFVVGNGSDNENRRNAFYVNNDGNCYASGAYYASSDIRKKDIVSDISLDKAYELVDKCQTIFYTWKNDEEKKQQIGLIAQEVQEYFPELVSEGSDGYLSLDYSKLTVILMSVIKDLTNRVKKLEILEERIKKLEEKDK